MATKPATKSPKPAAKPAVKEAKATTAVAVKASNSVVSIKEALAKQAAELGDKTLPASGNTIRLDGKEFTFPDGTKSPGPVELVIVEFVTKHAFYPGKYDKNNIVPPTCAAVGTDPRNLAPFANSPEPQSPDCQQCPNNVFGSDGDGKACKNSRALAVMPPDADEDTPIWLLNVSPTAIKGFDGYVNAVARAWSTVPVGVVTTVSFDENQTYPKLVFSDPKPNENVGVHFARQAEARELLMAEPDFTRVEAPKKPAKKVANARR